MRRGSTAQTGPVHPSEVADRRKRPHLADLDGTRRSREAGQARFKGRHLREGAPAADVDARHPELVGGPWLQLHLPHLAVIWRQPRVVLWTQAARSQQQVSKLQEITQ